MELVMTLKCGGTKSISQRDKVELGKWAKPGMSYINENSFSRWIIEKSDGLTTLGLQKLSETIRDYAYLILTSQTSTRGPIVGHEA